MNHPTQFYLALTQTVTVERGISLVCIPDRDSAQCALTKLRDEYGPNLIKATIYKDRSRYGRTYTLRYFIRETETHRLF